MIAAFNNLYLDTMMHVNFTSLAQLTVLRIPSNTIFYKD